MILTCPPACEESCKIMAVNKWGTFMVDCLYTCSINSFVFLLQSQYNISEDV